MNKREANKIARQLYNTLVQLPEGSKFSMRSLAINTFGEFANGDWEQDTEDKYGDVEIPYMDLIGKIRRALYDKIDSRQYFIDFSRQAFLFLGSDVSHTLSRWLYLLSEFECLPETEFQYDNLEIKGGTVIAKARTAPDGYLEALIDIPPKAELTFKLSLYQAVLAWPIDGGLSYQIKNYEQSYLYEAPLRLRKTVTNGVAEVGEHCAGHRRYESRYQDTFKIKNPSKSTSVKVYLIIRPH